METHRITAFPAPAASPETISDTSHRVVLPIGLSYAGYEVFHASAVLTPHGVVGFCAISGTGKSTLAAAFCRRGYDAFADDALVLDFTSHPAQVTAISVPFSLRLTPDSPLLDTHVTEANVGAESPLAALYVLERAPEPARAEIIPLRATEAFPAILPHTYHLSLGDPERKRAILSRYLHLVSRIPVFKVVFSPDFAALPALVDAVVASLPGENT